MLQCNICNNLSFNLQVCAKAQLYQLRESLLIKWATHVVLLNHIITTVSCHAVFKMNNMIISNSLQTEVMRMFWCKMSQWGNGEERTWTLGNKTHYLKYSHYSNKMPCFYMRKQTRVATTKYNLYTCRNTLHSFSLEKQKNLLISHFDLNCNLKKCHNRKYTLLVKSLNCAGMATLFTCSDLILLSVSLFLSYGFIKIVCLK